MLIIWKDWQGTLYAFCRRECLEHYKNHLADPNYLFEKATFTEHSFGCWWCGGDLSEGVAWLPTNEPEKEQES